MAWLVVVAALAVIVAMLAHVVRAGTASWKRRIAALNQQHGLAFPIEPMLGSHYHGLLFDRANKKILFLNGDDNEVLDYDYVVRWTSEWSERRDGATFDYRIAVGTSDFDRPRLIFRTGSLHRTRDWMARLEGIFNQ